MLRQQKRIRGICSNLYLIWYVTKLIKVGRQGNFTHSYSIHSLGLREVFLVNIELQGIKVKQTMGKEVTLRQSSKFEMLLLLCVHIISIL